MSARTQRTKRSRFPKLAGMLAIGVACALAPPRPTFAGPAARAAHLAADYITGLDFDDARRELEGADPDDPTIVYEKARLALYESDCDGALALLARPDVAKTEAGSSLADIARGCARVTAATLVERDDASSVELRYQDEADRPLAPYIIDTVVKARLALTKDLGVTWPKPTRITIVRDLMSLSAMTGLPQEAAQTTGTVAVAKWGRVTLLSPRASRHGYSWRDTIAHELTHLAVTRATLDHAPLWLQEGVAKRGEIRWRPPGPFDDRPAADAIVTRGMELKLDLPLDKLGPSIAMLPSADAAMVAFAEVTSFVRFYAQTQGEDALPHLLQALRVRDSVDDALKAASNETLKGWDAKWRAYLAAKPKEPLPPIFGLGPEPVGSRDVRERVRLAELLLGRAHPAEALRQLDRIDPETKRKAGLDGDASLRHLRARAMEDTGAPPAGSPEPMKPADAAKIEAILGEPKDVVSSYGPWWAIRGRFARMRETPDAAAADGYFLEAIADDPFDVESACQTIAPADSGGDANAHKNPGENGLPKPPAGATPGQADATRALCDAARKRAEPPAGQD